MIYRLKRVLRKTGWFALGLWFISEGLTLAEVKLPGVFADHMVLQRDQPVCLWGSAQPGEKVTARLAGQSVTALTDSSGNWSLKLAPMRANSTPQVLMVAGHNTIKISDVLVGEVWLGAGQSNMIVGTKGAAQNDLVLAGIMAKTLPQIRIHSVGRPWRGAASEQINGSLPALPLAFAAYLQENLGVPVGLLVAAVPGSSTDFWLTQEAIDGDENCRKSIADYTATRYPAEEKLYQERLAKWDKAQADPSSKVVPVPAPVAPRQPGSATHEIGKHFEEHVRPLIPYTIRGVLWDQGENYASVVGTNQVMIMGALIESWRKEWQQGVIPWVYIQKPSGGGCAWDSSNPVTSMAEAFEAPPEIPPAPGEAKKREDYLQLMKFPRTYMAISTDLGSGVHPKCKSGYGARAAHVSLQTVYGGQQEYLGPIYAGHELQGTKIRIHFTHQGKGLVAAHSQTLQGFVVAGEDRRFVWADAVIENDTVVVSAPGISRPKAVRYAWASKMPWANLFNKDGFPAQSFRTDSW